MEQAQIENVFSRRVSRTLSTTVSQRQDLTFRQLRIFYEEHGFDTSGDYFLKNLGMFTDDGKFNYFARMLSDQSDVSIKLARFKGTDKIEIITNKEFGYCCILKSVYNILDALDNYNLPSVEITYPRRIEKFLVNKTALCEAAINAIVHNDYVRGGAPLFEIYDDRITIVSSGGLVPELTREEFFNGCSMPRNRELMRVFRDMELVENFGSGMRRIMQVYGEEVFKISEHFVRTEFYYDKDVLAKIGSTVITDTPSEPINGPISEPINEPVKLTKIAERVFGFLAKNPNATIDMLMIEIGVSRETVKRALKALRDKGYIRRVGSKKTGYYEILKRD